MDARLRKMLELVVVVVGETGSSKGGTNGGDGGGEAKRIGETDRLDESPIEMGLLGTGEWRKTVLRLVGEKVTPNGLSVRS